MKRFISIIALLLCAVMLFAACGTSNAGSSNNEGPVVTDNEQGGKHYAFRIGCSSEARRAENLIAAAEMLNEQLKAEGSKDTVSLEYVLVDDITATMNLWMQEKNLPEFIAQTKGTICDFYEAGAIIDASYVVNDEVYSTKVAQALRDMGKFEDAYPGVILDTECRFVIIYKPALVALGWSEEQIETWKAEARAGKITTADLQEVAKQVVDAGICEYGITHRPNKGSDWRFTFISWTGGEVPLNEQGQVIIDRSDLIDYLTFWRTNVQMGLTPYNLLTDYNWDMLEGDIWPNGKSFCWYGQIAAKGDMMAKNSIASETVDANYFSIPNPAPHEGDPVVSGANPYFYALTTASQVDETTAEYCRRILDNVLDPTLQLNTSLYATHIAITEETAQLPEYQADGWMSDATYLGDISFCLPSNEYLSMYGNSQEMFDAIQKAEVEALKEGADSVEKIAEDLISAITFNMGEGNYVIVD